MKLDRSKPFGTVHGSAEVAFEQDGRLFNHEGDLIGGEPDKPTEKPADKPRIGRPPKQDAALDSQLASQLGQ